MQQSYNSHIDCTGASARSYQRPGVFRQQAPLAIYAVWSGANPEHDKPVIQKP